MSGESAVDSKVLGVVVVDLERAAIGTRSRVGDVLRGETVLQRVLERLLAVREWARWFCWCQQSKWSRCGR